MAAWLSARAQDGEFIWRIEDLDLPRAVDGIAERQLDDFVWLGMDWDASADQQHEEQPVRQSERGALYEDALRRLEQAELLFPCSLSRKDLRSIASAPHDLQDAPYPQKLRPQSTADGWLDDLLQAKQPDASVRFKAPSDPIRFEDAVFGVKRERVDQTVGDFVVRRRDGLWAYQLAVVVDDALQGVTEVVRGSDLLSSTARQISLQRALGFPTPRYMHLPLITSTDGEKLSKRHQALTIRSLRERGVPAEDLIGFMAKSLGLQPTDEPTTARSLIIDFDPKLIPKSDVVVPARFLQAAEGN